jgi:hypothetical protein
MQVLLCRYDEDHSLKRPGETVQGVIYRPISLRSASFFFILHIVCSLISSNCIASCSFLRTVTADQYHSIRVLYFPGIFVLHLEKVFIELYVGLNLDKMSEPTTNTPEFGGSQPEPKVITPKIQEGGGTEPQEIVPDSKHHEVQLVERLKETGLPFRSQDSYSIPPSSEHGHEAFGERGGYNTVPGVERSLPHDEVGYERFGSGYNSHLEHRHEDFGGRGGYNATPDHEHPTFGGRGGYNDAPGVEHSSYHTPSKVSQSHNPSFEARSSLEGIEHEGFGGRGGYNATLEHEHEAVGGLGSYNTHVEHSHEGFGGRGGYNATPDHDRPSFGGRGGYNDAPGVEIRPSHTPSIERGQSLTPSPSPTPSIERRSSHPISVERRRSHGGVEHEGFGGRGGYNATLEHEHEAVGGLGSYNAHLEHSHESFGGRGGYNATPDHDHPAFGGRGGYNDAPGVERRQSHTPSTERRQSQTPSPSHTPSIERRPSHEGVEHEGFGGRGGYSAHLEHSHEGFGGRGGYNATPDHDHPAFGGRGGYNDAAGVERRPSYTPSIESRQSHTSSPSHTPSVERRPSHEGGEHEGFGGRGGYNATLEHGHEAISGHGGHNSGPGERRLSHQVEHEGFGGRGGFNATLGFERRSSHTPSVERRPSHEGEHERYGGI